MQLGRNKIGSPGLQISAIRNNFSRALQRSGGNALSYPIDHLEEHGHQYYEVRGWRSSFINPQALIDVANEGKAMCMAVLPGLGATIGRMTKGEMPLIWKLNKGAGNKANGDYVTVKLYSNIDDAMKIAIDNGAVFWGATYYHFSLNSPEMLAQIAEMDEAGAKYGLGGVVWNYPRGSMIQGGDANIFNQLRGFEAIINACPASLVLVKEKVSTPPGTGKEWGGPVIKLWEEGNLEEFGWGKPGNVQSEEAVRAFMALDRAQQIEYMVATQHNMGIPSLMSGGAPQKPDQFRKDVEDGIAPNRHIAFIAGRSTTSQIKAGDEYDISNAVAHFNMLNDAAPEVVIED